MVISDFTTDNLGNPDAYTVQKECRKIRVREKDLTAATLARIRIHPVGSTAYYEISDGGEWIYETQGWILPFSQPFSTESVNVSSTVLAISEE